MLKTNNRVFLEKLDNYVLENMREAEDHGANVEEIRTPKQAYKVLYNYFMATHEGNRLHPAPQFLAFEHFAQGLPCCGLFLYYYNEDPIKLLGDMLEQTKEERSAYTWAEAERMLTSLIHREMMKKGRY